MSAYETLSDLLQRRHSCRAFRPEAVPRDVIERILAAAQRVPSWCNAQPWQVVLTSGAETDRLRDGLLAEAASGADAPDLPFPEAYTGIYKARRSSCGWALYNAVGVERGDRAGAEAQMRENFRAFGAPHVALIHSPAELGAYGAVDCGGYVTAFTLAAAALGVATIPQAAVALMSPFLHRHFDIPEDRLIVCAISFGYADPDHPANAFRTERAALEEVVDWRGAPR
jgi:nitroreductase